MASVINVETSSSCTDDFLDSSSRSINKPDECIYYAKLMQLNFLTTAVNDSGSTFLKANIAFRISLEIEYVIKCRLLNVAQ